MSDGGNGASARPIYNEFVEQAKKLNPKYLTMIIPSRWFAGGKGLDEFRKNMLEDRHISKMVDYVNAKDCFPGVSLGGGVNYFLWDKSYCGKCEFTNIHDNKKVTSARDLNEFSVFVRYNEAVSIIHKIINSGDSSLVDCISNRNPYGFPSSSRGNENELEIKLYSSAGFGYVNKNELTTGLSSVVNYKVIISKVTSEHAGEPDKSGKFKVISRAKILNPNGICTDSYLVAYNNPEKAAVKNFYTYLCTKFFRFSLLQSVSSINLSKEKFCFVPIQDFSKPWTDEELYAKYNLTDEEIEFIESMIKPMELDGEINA